MNVNFRDKIFMIAVRTHVKNATPIIIFVKKIFVNERLIVKITKILYHENLELYGIEH